MTSNTYVGLRFDQYEILEELGRGGSARVYRAYDHLAKREVAVKIIPNDVEDRQDFIARFEREIEIVRALSHPHIVDVYGAGETEEVVYLVMRHLRGGTLRDRLTNGPLPVGLAALYASQMARALHHAHQHGIIHRDVKPSNMLLGAEDPYHLLLADFGIAKIQGIRGMTKSGIAIGTPEYMSPEQAEGKESDPRSDIYSLGIVLYEMLAGRPPFKGQSPVAIMYQHVHVRPAYIRGYNAQAPIELCRIAETALRKSPDERYPTAERFAQALAPFLGFSDEIAATRSGGPRQTLTPRLYSNPAMPFAAPYAAPTSKGIARVAQEEREQVARIETVPPAVGLNAEPAQSTPPPGETASPSYPLRTLHQTYGPAIGQRPSGGVVTRRLSEDDLAMEAVEQATASSSFPPTMNSAEQDTLTRGAPAVLKGSPAPRRRVSSEPLQLPVRTEGPKGKAAGGALLARTSPAPSEPAETTSHDDAGSQGGGGKRPRRRGWLIALVVIVALGLLGALAMNAGAIRFLPRGVAATATAMTTAAATAEPTIIPTTAPAGTATLTLQQQLDRQASGSFRSITLGKSQDGSCGSSTTAFSAGQTVFVNLCTSSRVAPGPVTVSIRQVGGLCTLPPDSNGALTSTASYYCYSTFPLGAGAYDMVVSVKINGSPATARVIHFTVSG
jgi:serine/threonine protein kinase